MAAPPFSGSVLILRENQDGIVVEVFHWTDLADGATVPPRGPLTGVLNGGGFVPSGPPLTYTFHTERIATTKTELVSKFSAYVAALFTKTPS